MTHATCPFSPESPSSVFSYEDTAWSNRRNQKCKRTWWQAAERTEGASYLKGETGKALGKGKEINTEEGGRGVWLFG